MELHKSVKIENTYGISMKDDYLTYFLKAKQLVDDHYKETLDTISNTKFENVSPEFFYKEFCWCVATSGFNAKVVSRFFPKLMEALSPFNEYFYGDKNFYQSLASIRTNALNVFANKRKIDAMIECAKRIHFGIGLLGWKEFKIQHLNTPDKLVKLPYIGKITKHHLARNLGLLDNVKPDLHLERSSKYWGFDTPLALCQEIKKQYDLPLGIIDYCLFMAMSSYGSKTS